MLAPVLRAEGVNNFNDIGLGSRWGRNGDGLGLGGGLAERFLRDLVRERRREDGMGHSGIREMFERYLMSGGLGEGRFGDCGRMPNWMRGMDMGRMGVDRHPPMMGRDVEEWGSNNHGG